MPVPGFHLLVQVSLDDGARGAAVVCQHVVHEAGVRHDRYLWGQTAQVGGKRFKGTPLGVEEVGSRDWKEAAGC
jgi:hypothetical protein